LHLAAIHFIPYCNEHPFQSSEINIKGTINVLKACEEYGKLKMFFFASTAAVYPIYDGPINELLEPNPTDIYGLSKLVGEKLVDNFHLVTNTPSIICRFFNAFGPNETNPHLIPEILNQIKYGNTRIKIGNTEPKRDFIHTSDMASAINFLLSHFDSGIEIINLGQGKEYSVTEVINCFNENLPFELELEIDPLKVRKSDRLHLLADISKLKKLSTWEPQINLSEGIKKLLE